MFRGGSSAIPRAFVGSTSQLTSFAYCKEFMRKYDVLTDSPLLMTFTASMVGGVAISLMMTPFDLVSTRLYNQGKYFQFVSNYVDQKQFLGVDKFGKGLLYSGYIDCVFKIWKTEGFLGFYKGLGPSYFRLGPHTVLCLVFWDEFKELYSRYK